MQRVKSHLLSLSPQALSLPDASSSELFGATIDTNERATKIDLISTRIGDGAGPSRNQYADLVMINLRVDYGDWVQRLVKASTSIADLKKDVGLDL